MLPYKCEDLNSALGRQRRKYLGSQPRQISELQVQWENTPDVDVCLHILTWEQAMHLYHYTQSRWGEKGDSSLKCIGVLTPFLICSVLGIKPRALYTLGGHATTPLLSHSRGRKSCSLVKQDPKLKCILTCIYINIPSEKNHLERKT